VTTRHIRVLERARLVERAVVMVEEAQLLGAVRGIASASSVPGTMRRTETTT
jgi:hypothetical protein